MMSPPSLSPVKQIKIHIVPNAKVNQIVGQVGDRIKVKVAAPPVWGKANKELINFFSKQFKIHRSQISITEGEKSRLKTVTIREEK